MNYEKWKQLWRIGNGSQRLGQAFVTEFMIGEAWQLFYEEDYWQADEWITQWLINNCHYPNVPEKVSS